MSARFISPGAFVFDADELMGKYKISGVPICEKGKLVGIITNRDLRFLSDYNCKIKEVMTRKTWSPPRWDHIGPGTGDPAQAQD